MRADTSDKDSDIEYALIYVIRSYTILNICVPLSFYQAQIGWIG